MLREGLETAGAADRPDDAASRRGDVADARPRRPARRRSPGRWPIPTLARDEQVTIAVQVNGKLRGTLDLPRDADAGDGRERGAGAAAGAAAARRPARRARSSSCPTGSSMSWSRRALLVAACCCRSAAAASIRSTASDDAAATSRRSPRSRCADPDRVGQILECAAREAQSARHRRSSRAIVLPIAADACRASISASSATPPTRGRVDVMHDHLADSKSGKPVYRGRASTSAFNLPDDAYAAQVAEDDARARTARSCRRHPQRVGVVPAPEQSADAPGGTREARRHASRAFSPSPTRHPRGARSMAPTAAWCASAPTGSPRRSCPIATIPSASPSSPPQACRRSGAPRRRGARVV